MRKTLLLLTVSIMLLVACTGGSNTGTVGPDKTPFRGGENGLQMEFLDGSPPDEIFDNKNYPFGVVVQLENLGEDDVDVGDGFIRVTGINPVDFGLSGQADLERPIPPMDSTKKNFDGTLVDGDTDNVEFPGLNYQLDLPGNILQPRIRAEACYNYRTRTATLICIKPDLLSKTETRDICDVSSEKDPQNSGGPLQITSMKQTAISSGKIQVNFVVEHVGEANDRFFKVGTDCDDRVTNVDKEKVLVRVTSDVNGAIPKCTGLQESNSAGNEGFVTLFDRVPRTVVCEIDISSIDSTFEELFEVELDYRYFQFIERSVLIKDVGGSDS